MDKAMEKMAYKCMSVACSRLSDSTEDTKRKRHAKSWRAGKRKKFPPVLFSCWRFLNSGGSTISEPKTG